MMIKDLPEGYEFALRMVSEDDAEFMVDLRRHPTQAMYMHETSPDIGAQRDWIRSKVSSDDDLTMLLEEKRTRQPVGFISIYEFDHRIRSARYGRLMTVPHSRCVPEFTLLVYRTAFEILNLQQIYAKVVIDNLPINRFLTSIGNRKVLLYNEFTSIRGTEYAMVRYEVDSMLWAELRPRLEESVAKTSRPRS